MESGSDEDLRAVMKEVELAKAHPHLVQVLGYCKQPPALVSEFMAGGDLQKVLQSPEKRSRLSLVDRLKILSQAATGIGHLHSSNILHKDVKPANVLLKYQLQESGGQKRVVAKIADFGISREMLPGQED